LCFEFFPHYLINGTIFGKKLLNTECVFWFSLQRLSEIFLILRRIERDIIKNVYRSSCKVPVIFLDFNEIRIIFLDFRSKIKYRISWKAIQWERSCSMRTDGRTDYTTMLIVIYCNVRRHLKYYTFCRVHPRVLCRTENKQRLFPYTALTDWFL